VIEIISFGYGHPDGIPDADLVIDLRPYRDPHIRPEFRTLTAFDQEVRDTVRTTPGIPQLLAETVQQVDQLAARRPTVTIASGCVGGRHRGPAFALDLVAALQKLGHRVDYIHRDINKPVISR
jgi:UPF0042 nucleotide-binding protein